MSIQSGSRWNSCSALTAPTSSKHFKTQTSMKANIDILHDIPRSNALRKIPPLRFRRGEGRLTAPKSDEVGGEGSVFAVRILLARAATVATMLTSSLLPSPALAKLNAVATTPDLASIAREIGGNQVDITTLAKPTEDPHFVDAKPSFIVKLNHADALIEGGAELEIGWLPALLDQARNPKLEAGKPGRILCNEGISLLEVPSTLDRSKGDIHAAGNPHYMTDPSNARIVAAHIAEEFAALDPKSADM